MFLQAIVEILAEEQDDCQHSHGDIRVSKVEHRPEEQRLARSVVDKREVEHIHYAAVEPCLLSEQTAVENAVDDVSQCAGSDQRDHSYVPRACTAIEQRVDIPTQ